MQLVSGNLTIMDRGSFKDFFPCVQKFLLDTSPPFDQSNFMPPK